MKKNELVIFEELKLKTPQSQWSSEHSVSSTPKEKDLKSIKLFEYFSKKFNKKTGMLIYNKSLSVCNSASLN